MDGVKPSYSRVMGSFLIIFPVAWITFVVIYNHVLPPATDLIAVAGIITTGVGLYSVNKFATPAIVKAVENCKPDGQ